ncbi:MAG: DUF418 domain-containing protein [Alistipes sp.]|nr:DUF418 domain-containing protein [Alistipes sp.]
MYSYSPSGLPNSRIDVADVLRGIAIGGIVLIHFVEHMNFYMFPEPTAIDRAVWDTLFFLLAGKMYAIFALLFGLSLYIQHDNQAQRGVDFRPRFVWRMVLLMMFGLVDLCFYNGDILFLYAVCGLVVLPLVRLSSRALRWIAAVLLLQPVELVYMILGLSDESLRPLSLGSGAHFAAIMPAQIDGSLIDVAAAGIEHGLPCNFLWAIEHGRMTQTLLLFVVGILIGRSRLFYDEGDNLRKWRAILVSSAAAFALLYPLSERLPEVIDNVCVAHSARVMLSMWRNLSMMFIIVSGVVLLFYLTRARRVLMAIAPYGKMSLTNYIGQSVIGGMLFYGWGFGLYRYSGHTMSLLLGMAVVVLQCMFCRWWLAHHKRGLLEQLWHRATWIGR